MTDPQYLHRYWNRIIKPKSNGLLEFKNPEFPNYHPKIVAFEKIYRQMKATKDDDIISSCRIELPFQVLEGEMEIHRIGDKPTGTYTLYVNLKAYGGSMYDVASAGPIIMLD